MADPTYVGDHPGPWPLLDGFRAGKSDRASGRLPAGLSDARRKARPDARSDAQEKDYLRGWHLGQRTGRPARGERGARCHQKAPARARTQRW
ncbi:MAG: hypothetical protein AB7K67_01155, partial [Hyphomicrobiaceae bacterium]